MEHLFEIQNLLISQFEQDWFYKRHCFNKIHFDNHLSGLIGARGIGKTTLLIQQAIHRGAKQQKALYVSADNYYLLKTPLLSLVDRLYKETEVTLLCIDEIQKYENWNQELKNIADTYKNFRVLFSGSSMIDIVKAKYDLSRRATLHHLHGLSFREYLEFSEKQQLPVITLKEILTKHEEISTALNIEKILKHFNDYLRIGYYPFFEALTVDTEKFQAIENSIQKTLYEDIAVSCSLKTTTLLTLEKLYRYVVNSAPGEVSAYKLASTLGKDYESVSEYLRLLQQAGLIRFIFTEKSGKALLRNPTKMYADNSNLVFSASIPDTSEAIRGKIRETFVINQLQNSSHSVFYSEHGDFTVDGVTLEVGGKNKSTKQIKDIKNSYIFSDGIVTGFKNKIPLYLLGFLY